MGFLKHLFGGADNQDNRLEQVEIFMNQGSKAIYDHYNMQGVVDSVRQFTDVKDFTVKEAVQVVNKKRAQRGWEPVHPEEILSSDPDKGSVFCRRCRMQHSGGQC